MSLGVKVKVGGLNVGMLERWMLECWNVGMLERWNVGMLERWNVCVRGLRLEKRSDDTEAAACFFDFHRARNADTLLVPRYCILVALIISDYSRRLKHTSIAKSVQASFRSWCLAVYFNSHEQ